MSPSPLIVYLHGFLSSPESKKARQTHQYIDSLGLSGLLRIPQLHAGPAATIEQLTALVAGHSRVAFIGSSLGGFYATCMAERLAAPAVLINPAIRPADYWQRYIGEHKNFHSDTRHTVTPEHVRELAELAPDRLAEPANYRAYLQVHDEVLDYRRALSLYGDAQCVVRSDGDHSYENFHLELPEAIQFLLSRIGHSVR